MTDKVNRRLLRKQFGIRAKDGQYVVALAGNPNVGKSTVFNVLTGLRQHTGNWPVKQSTMLRASFLIGALPFCW